MRSLGVLLAVVFCTVSLLNGNPTSVTSEDPSVVWIYDEDNPSVKYPGLLLSKSLVISTEYASLGDKLVVQAGSGLHEQTNKVLSKGWLIHNDNPQMVAMIVEPFYLDEHVAAAPLSTVSPVLDKTCQFSPFTNTDGTGSIPVRVARNEDCGSYEANSDFICLGDLSMNLSGGFVKCGENVAALTTVNSKPNGSPKRLMLDLSLLQKLAKCYTVDCFVDSRIGQAKWVVDPKKTVDGTTASVSSPKIVLGLGTLIFSVLMTAV